MKPWEVRGAPATVYVLPSCVAGFFREPCQRSSCHEFWLDPAYDVPADWITSDGVAHYLCPHCGRAWRTWWALWLYDEGRAA